ncbi:Purine-cytosine permease FCY22 [Fusarium beomiforme]|uniref:Purine-cytosine permease FCY22 n=1 Tax=Fusarium beomiforme TaxID=44412 RepID=A0A9P5E5K1_9HYPO|nr:Purine-cytosine permease FCY22 [Fusarium beomiforme]
MAALKDLEAGHEPHISEHTTNNKENGENTSVSSTAHQEIGLPSKWFRRMLDAGVEENGILPVPPEQRTQTQPSNLFTVFFTCLLCILPLPTGALGTTVYGLGLRDVSLIIIFFNILTCIPPAIISIGGCKTGMRQMIQARYSFGLYLGIIPILLNAGTVTGFTLVGSIVSGQAIAAVNGKANISVNVGIGIVCTLSFCLALKIFTFVYLGLLTPSTPLLILGAAIGGAIPNNESWQIAWDRYGTGGVMAEMLAPAGGFGKFVLVILALSVVGNMVLSNYSVALCLQMLIPVFAKVPRFFFIMATLAIMIPMSIYAAAQWEESLGNFLAVISYWAGCFDAIVIEELIVFRSTDYSSYDPQIWNQAQRLPTGLAAIGASLVSLGLVVPSMDTPWFTGPIGERIGDLGFETAFVVTGIAYYPLRTLEARLMGHV